MDFEIHHMAAGTRQIPRAKPVLLHLGLSIQTPPDHLLRRLLRSLRDDRTPRRLAHGKPDGEQSNLRQMKAMTKSQLARKAGVSEQTLRVWLRDPYIREQLAPLKLKKQQIILPPAAVQIIVNHYAIEID